MMLLLCAAGKKLIACRTAVDGFSDIVGTVGGEQEKARARYDYIAIVLLAIVYTVTFPCFGMLYY